MAATHLISATTRRDVDIGESLAILAEGALQRANLNLKPAHPARGVGELSVPGTT